jgi:hypothetical protein
VAVPLSVSAKTRSPEVGKLVPLFKEAPTCLAVSPSSQHILVASADGTVTELRLKFTVPASLSVVGTRAALHKEPISSIAVSPLGSLASTDIAQRLLLHHWHPWSGAHQQSREPSLTLRVSSRWSGRMLFWVAVIAVGGLAVTVSRPDVIPWYQVVNSSTVENRGAEAAPARSADVRPSTDSSDHPVTTP